MKIDPACRIILEDGRIGYVVELDEDTNEVVVECEGERFILDGNTEGTLVKRDDVH